MDAPSRPRYTPACVSWSSYASQYSTRGVTGGSGSGGAGVWINPDTNNNSLKGLPAEGEVHGHAEARQAVSSQAQGGSGFKLGGNVATSLVSAQDASASDDLASDMHRTTFRADDSDNLMLHTDFRSTATYTYIAMMNKKDNLAAAQKMNNNSMVSKRKQSSDDDDDDDDDNINEPPATRRRRRRRRRSQGEHYERVDPLGVPAALANSHKTLATYAATAARDPALWANEQIQQQSRMQCPPRREDGESRRRRHEARTALSSQSRQKKADATTIVATIPPTFRTPQKDEQRVDARCGCASTFASPVAPAVAPLIAETCAEYAVQSYGRMSYARELNAAPVLSSPASASSESRRALAAGRLRSLADEVRGALGRADAMLREAQRESAAAMAWRVLEDNAADGAPPNRIAGVLFVPSAASLPIAELAVLLHARDVLCPIVAVQLLPACDVDDNEDGLPLHAHADTVHSLAWSAHRNACATLALATASSAEPPSEHTLEEEEAEEKEEGEKEQQQPKKDLQNGSHPSPGADVVVAAATPTPHTPPLGVVASPASGNAIVVDDEEAMAPEDLPTAAAAAAVAASAAVDVPHHKDVSNVPALVPNPYGVCLVRNETATPQRVHGCYQWFIDSEGWHIAAAWMTSDGTLAAARVYGPATPSGEGGLVALLRQLRVDTCRLAAAVSKSEVASSSPPPPTEPETAAEEAAPLSAVVPSLPPPCILRLESVDAPPHGESFDAAAWRALAQDEGDDVLAGTADFPSTDLSLDAWVVDNGNSACVARADTVTVDVQLWTRGERMLGNSPPAPTTPAFEGDEGEDDGNHAACPPSPASHLAAELYALLQLDAHAAPFSKACRTMSQRVSCWRVLPYHVASCRAAASLVTLATTTSPSL